MEGITLASDPSVKTLPTVARIWRIIAFAGLALILLLATFLIAPIAISVIWNFTSTSDRRIEKESLPSGEILENHTYYETGFRDGSRHNQLYLTNPKTGGSELVGDLEYEAAPNAPPSLFAEFRGPREIVSGDEKVLIIGPYVCKRWNLKGGPLWYVASFKRAWGGAVEYLLSFDKSAHAMTVDREPGEGPDWHLRYQIESLDLANNILTLKRVPWDAGVDTAEYRDGYPDYLVYSSIGYHGQSGFKFPWTFDLTRTRIKNGVHWEKPMPFKMALDFSVIAFPVKPGEAPRPLLTRDAMMAVSGATEIGSATLELSDQELRSVECRYPVCGDREAVEKIEAMYGNACLQPNRFQIVWEPRNPAAWPISGMDLNEWVEVGEGACKGKRTAEYIRLRRIDPELP
jgi:hypothetical protein